MATLLILTEPWSLGSVHAPCLGLVTRSGLGNSPHMSARRHPPDEGLKCRGCSGREVRVCQPPCPPPHTTHVHTVHLHCASVHTHSRTHAGEGGEDLSPLSWGPGGRCGGFRSAGWGRGGVRRRRTRVRREDSSGGSSLDPAWRKGLWVGAQSRVHESRLGLGGLYMGGPLQRTC